jgi:hypothetical protein
MDKRDCRFVALNDKSCIDGKTKASFITYQRLCENSLATWWRNVFLTTSVSLTLEKRGDDTAFMLLLCCANILLAWAVWSYKENLEKIMEAAEERGYILTPNWSYMVLGGLFYAVHLYFTLSVLF